MRIGNKLFIYSQVGFTLVELMLAIFIFTIITGAIFIVLNTGRNSWQSGDARIGAQEELRRGLYAMVRELRQTKSTKVTDVLGGTSFSEWSDPYPVITFCIPTGITNGTISWSNQIQYRLDTDDVYYPDGRVDQLIRRFDTDGDGDFDTATVLANRISKLEFQKVASILQVYLAAEVRTIVGWTVSDTLQTQVMFRN